MTSPSEGAAWLAAQLAQRFDGRLPEPWTASAEADAVVFRLGGTVRSTNDLSWIFDHGYPSEETLVLAAEHVLSDVQDSLADWSTDPWPAERGHLPVPYARIESDLLLCGYGAPDDPVMALAPIPVIPTDLLERRFEDCIGSAPLPDES